MKTKLLAATALVVFTVGAPVVSLAADNTRGFDPSKLRQLVVEPKGADVTAATDQAPVLAVEPKGVDVADSSVGKQKLVIDPTPVETPDVVKPKIAIEPEGVDTADNGGGSKVLPIVIEPEGGAIDEPEVANNPPPKTVKPRPVPADPIVADNEPEIAPAPDVTPEAPAVAETPIAPPAKAPAATVDTAEGLLTILTDKGYKVDVLKTDAHGRQVFYVTPADGSYAYLLLVDAYGKVLNKRAVSVSTVADNGYEAPAYDTPTYANSYTPAPAYDDGYEAPSYQADAYDDCGSTESYGY